MKKLHGICKGNYTYCIDENICGQVDDIFKSKQGVDMVSIILEGTKLYKELEKIQPIVLDRDWLVLFDFWTEKYNGGTKYKRVSENGAEITIDMGHGNNSIPILSMKPKSVAFAPVWIEHLAIKYVHQLQYTYHLITDEILDTIPI